MLEDSSWHILSRFFKFLGLCLSTDLFSSAHRFSIGLRSDDWDGHCRTLILLSWNHFCVDLQVCFGSLSWWKVHLRPSPSLLDERTRFSAKIAWYLVEFIMPSILTSAPGPLELKQSQNITDPLPYFTVGMRCFSLRLCSYAKHADAVPDKNIPFWSHLTRTPCSNHNTNDIWCFLLCLVVRKGFLLATLQGCGYGGGVWWCFLKPGEPKTASRPEIPSLWSLGILLLLSSFSISCRYVLYPWGNSSISFELLYNCSDSAQWYIQSFANVLVAITTFMKVYDHLPLLNCQFFMVLDDFVCVLQEVR